MKSADDRTAKWTVLQVTLPVLLTFVLFAGTIFFLELPSHEAHIIEQKRMMIRELVGLALSNLAHLEAGVQQGVHTREEAQRIALDQIRAFRYGPEGKDYFWLMNREPRVLMHPYARQFENMVLTDYADANGKRVFVEFVRASENPAGDYVEYLWQYHEDASRIVPKIAYVRAFEPWGWIVGTGMYIEDVRAEIGRARKRMLMTSGLILVLSAGLAGFVIWRAYVLNRQRSHAVRLVQQREQLYRALFDNATDTIILMRGGQVVEFNQKALDMFQCTREQLLGSRIGDFSPEFQPSGQPSQELGDALAKRVLDGKPLFVEWRCKRANGEPFDAEVSGSYLEFDHHGYQMAIIRDISSRKSTEAELAVTRSFLEAAIEQSPAGIIIADAPDGRIRVANRVTFGTEDESGVRHEDLVNLSSLHERTFWPDGRAVSRADSPLALAIRAGKVSKNVEMLMRVSDSLNRTVLVNAAPVRDSEGAIIAGVSVFYDITDHRQLEEQLRQAQKMEAIGQLAGGVAHDFNNILQAILGYGEMALEEAAPNSELHAELLEVRKAAERAAVLVRQLLAFSRRQVLNLQIVTLDHVIHDLVKMIVRVIGEDITLNVRTGPGLRTIRADRGQIEQVLMNLCINARDAMLNGGEITIRTENMEISEHYCKLHVEARPGPHVLLTISDTGCGMDAEVQKHIFEPFFSTKEQSKGTGLGLATVYGIVRQHGGFINVYSEPGRGSVFKIYFPVVDESAGEVKTLVEADVKGGTETILLAEDNPDVRTLAQVTLERAGYTVLPAANGSEAIALFDSHVDTIRLALLDVVMPQLGGRAVSDYIHEKCPALPIVFASGYSADSAHGSLTLDADMRLIEKPYDRNTLLRTIREALDA